MKVLFALGNEQLSKRVAEKYFEKYGEELEYKNVFYFKALLDEVKKDKTYDRIVIKEELEQFQLKNIESLDKFIFNNIDNVTDEIEDSEIIFICSDRRTKDHDKFVERLFNIGVYNTLIGDERVVSSLCDYIKKPMNKKEAKRHLNINSVVSDGTMSTRDDEVEEIQIMNILKYYENIKGKTEEYIPAFDRIAEQYSRNQLKVILYYLPADVKKAVLSSDKYKFLSDSDIEKNDNNNAENKDIKNNPNKTKKKGLFSILKESKFKDTKKQPEVIVDENANIQARLRKEAEEVEAKQQAELKARAEQEAKAREEAEFAKQQEELRIRAEQEAKAREEAELAKQQEELRIIAEQEARAREEAELAKQQEELRIRAEQEAKAREEAKQQEKLKERTVQESKTKDELGIDKRQAEIRAKAQQEWEENELKRKAELKEKEEQEVKAREEAEFAKQQEELRIKVEQEAKAKEEAEFVKQQEELRIKAEIEAKAREEAEFAKQQEKLRIKAEQELKSKQEAELKEKVMQEAMKKKAEQEKLEEEKRRLEQEKLALEEEKRKLQEQSEKISKTAEVVSNTVAIPQAQMLDNRPLDIKKMVVFVGANKSGTTFLTNAIAHHIASQNVSVGIIDMAKDKSMYYIYNQDDKDLRKIASECMKNLSEGIDSYIPGAKNLKIYTSVPGPSAQAKNAFRNRAVIDTVKQSNALVIVDADFSTSLEYFEKAQEIYIVQDMDIMKMQDTTMFIRELKNRSIDMKKIRILVNKYVKSMLTPKKIIQGLSYYNDPQMSFIDELLDSRVQYYIVPFNIENYSKYIDGMYKNSINYNKFTEDFKQAISEISNDVYRRANGVKSAKRRGIFG